MPKTKRRFRIKTKAKKTKKRSTANPRVIELRREIEGISLIGVAILIVASLTVKETGLFGEYIKKIIFTVSGEKGAYIPTIFLSVLGWQLMRNPRKPTFTHRFFGFSLLCLWGITLSHMMAGLPAYDLLPLGYEEGGGFIGSVIVYGLYNTFSFVGTLIVLGLFLIIALILMLDRPLVQFLREMAALVKHAFLRLESKGEPDAPPSLTEQRVFAALETAATEQAPIIHSQGLNGDASIDLSLKSNRRLGPFHPPSVDLLRHAPRPKRGSARNIDQSIRLEETLASFGVRASVIDVYQGPVITRYDLQPAPGVKVSRIVNLANDLALALAAGGLRIEAPIPGKAAIGIEVPNKEPRVVTLRELVETKVFWDSGKLGVALGVDIAGEPVIADLTKMPHLLIAGATGSGKSVCLSALIISLLYKASPEEVKLIMIDPKMVELSAYDGIPHLSSPVVTETKKASAVLKAVVAEMEARYKTFADRGVRDISRYNQTLSKEEPPMPYVVVVIDELADLMMIAPVDVEDAICRLAQMARATGIHLVVATQRPSVDVITGLIKANIPSRVAFAVSSQVDSRTIIDGVGAEQLLGKGDMLFSPIGSLKPRRLQGALVLDSEIKAVTDHWRSQGDPEYKEAFLNAKEAESTQDDLQAEDELFWDAVQLVIDHGQASVSVLQRRLRVGYTRAARIVDMMEERGFIGPYEGSKPREVLITSRQLEELLNRSKK